MIADDRPELTLVIPIYNGESGIASTLERWREALNSLPAEIIVIDDGSTDGTGKVLDRLASDFAFPGLRVIHQENAGHGPAVRRGYESARGRWVFQADSDDEIDPLYFRKLWEQREEGEFVLAEREGRACGPIRRAITGVEALITGLIGEHRLRDPNVPFRLIRSDRLEEFLGAVGPDEFAPNLLMSLWALRKNWRIIVVKLPHNLEQNPHHSLNGAKLLRGCALAFRGVFRLFLSRESRKKGKRKGNSHKKAQNSQKQKKQMSGFVC